MVNFRSKLDVYKYRVEKSAQKKTREETRENEKKGKESSCSVSSTGERFKGLKLHPGFHWPDGPRLHRSPFPVCD